MKYYWKPFLLLIFLFAAGNLLPAHPIDPWGILNAQKTVKLIFALSLCEVLGDLNLRLFGARSGALLHGFFGGLISSTALTASLAKESGTFTEEQSRTASLPFLTATLAMHLEALFILFTGAQDVHAKLLVLFVGPILVPILLILRSRRGNPSPSVPILNEGQIEFRSVFALTGFILLALSLSKFLERSFGAQALFAPTLVVSLFEIHGSIIANVQLHDAGIVDPKLLGDLLVTSFAASYLSKLFLVMTLGAPHFKRRAIRWLALTAGGTALSWLAFRALI